MNSSPFSDYYNDLRSRVEDALRREVDRQQWPTPLQEAVLYSLMAGGKRLRPVLVLMAAEVCGGKPTDAMPAAIAIEMIHTYSLIHDDLPSMDDDDLRRGRPTSHIVFGEALAILAGDALLTLAFECLSSAAIPANVNVKCISTLARAAGGTGMVGGQVLDLDAENGAFSGQNVTHTSASTAPIGEKVGLPEPETSVGVEQGRSESLNPASNGNSDRVDQLIKIHRMKTGALITAALQLGATVAEASPKQQAAVTQYGDCIGLAFQIADDLLDITGSNERMGKEPGRDSELGKLTYPSLLGIDGSRLKAQSLVDEACGSLDTFGQNAEYLRQLARFIVERDH